MECATNVDELGKRTTEAGDGERNSRQFSYSSLGATSMGVKNARSSRNRLRKRCARKLSTQLEGRQTGGEANFGELAGGRCSLSY